MPTRGSVFNPVFDPKQGKKGKRGGASTPPPDIMTAAFNANEGVPTTVTLVASELCDFFIVGGADQAQFSLSGADLTLFAQAFSGAGGNTRLVIVEAVSQATGLSATVTITATVLDVAPPANVTPPSITADLVEGGSNTATPAVWSGQLVGSPVGQWYVGDTIGAVTTPIAAATSPSVTKATAQVGRYIRYGETVTNGVDAVTSFSNVVGPIKNGILARIACRSTQAFTADDPRWVYALAVDTAPPNTSRVPASGALYVGDPGYTFGFEGTIGLSNGSVTYPKPCAGAATATGSSGRLLIPVTPGEQLRVKLAIGNPASSTTNSYGISDGDGTSYITHIPDTVVGVGNVMGADGVVRPVADFALDAGVLITPTQSVITIRRFGAANQLALRAVEITRPQFSQVTSGVGPFFVDLAAGNDITGDGSSGAPWAHIPGDPAAGGLVPAFNVLAAGAVNMQGGQHHRPASYAARSSKHLQFLRAGTAGSPIVYGAYGSGAPVIDGSEILTGWSAASSGDVFANPDLANIQKKAVTGVSGTAYFNTICEGEKYLAPAQWPSPACAYDFNRYYAGTDAYILLSPTDFASLVTTGANDSFAAGFKTCTITSNVGANNLKSHYGSLDLTGYVVSCLMVGNLLQEWGIDSYDVATGKVHFHIPNASQLLSNSAGWFGFAIRYHPFDIVQAGQCAYDVGRTTAFAHFFGSAERSIIRLPYGAVFDHDYVKLSGLTLARFGITDGAAVLNTGSATTRTGLELLNVNLRHIFNSSRNWALYLNDPMTTFSITNLDVQDCGVGVGGVSIGAAAGGTITGLRQRHGGRSTPYFNNVAHNIVASDIDVSDYDDVHGNGPTIYQGANHIEVKQFYAMNRPRPVSVQSDYTAPSRANHFHHFVTDTKMPYPGAQFTPADYAWQSFDGETDSLFEIGIIGGAMQIHPTAGRPASTGLVMRNLVIGNISAAELPGISVQNCLIFRMGSAGLSSLSGTGATDLGGNVFDPTGSWEGLITTAMQEMLTRNTGGSGYVQRNLGHSGYPWIIPAFGATIALSDGVLTTTALKIGHRAFNTFASFIGTQPGSSLTLPAGVTDNDLFALWKNKPYPLANLTTAGTYHLTFHEVNGALTHDTVVAVTVG